MSSLRKAQAITDPKNRAIALARIAWDEALPLTDERGEVIAFALSGKGVIALVGMATALEEIEEVES